MCESNISNNGIRNLFYITYRRICQCSAFLETENVSEFIRKVLKDVRKGHLKNPLGTDLVTATMEKKKRNKRKQIVKLITFI